MSPQEAAMRGALGGLPPTPTLGDIFGGGPKPVVVSPSSPAPVKPGVDIRAPQALGRPTAVPQRAILSARTPPPAAARAPAEAAVMEAEGADAAKGAEDRFARLYEQMRAKSQEDLKRAKDDARVDPEQEAILRSQEERSAEDYKDIEDQKRRRDWGALVDMGVAMATSQSPYFSAALAEGLRAGNKGLDESRLERVRQRALVKDREAQVRQARFNALQAARTEARQDLVTGEDMTAKRVQTAALTNDAIEKLATQPARYAKIMAEAEKARTDAEFAAEEAQADIGYKRAATAAQQAAAEESRAGAAAYRAGQRGGRGSQGDRYDREEIDKARLASDEALANARSTFTQLRETEKAGMASSRDKLPQLRAEFERDKRVAFSKYNQYRIASGKPPMSYEQFDAIQRGQGAPSPALRTAAPPAPAADPLGIR